MSTDLAQINDQLDVSHLSATICVELVTGLTSASAIPAKFGMTDEQWDRLKSSKFFQKMLKDAGEKFSGDLGAGRRITLKAEMLLEDSLPVLDEMVHNVDGSTQSKLDAVKQLAQLAGRNDKAQSSGPAGGGFNVQIHINTGEAEVKSAPVVIEQD